MRQRERDSRHNDGPDLARLRRGINNPYFLYSPKRASRWESPDSRVLRTRAVCRRHYNQPTSSIQLPHSSPLSSIFQLTSRLFPRKAFPRKTSFFDVDAAPHPRLSASKQGRNNLVRGWSNATRSRSPVTSAISPTSSATFDRRTPRRLSRDTLSPGRPPPVSRISPYLSREDRVRDVTRPSNQSCEQFRTLVDRSTPVA